MVLQRRAPVRALSRPSSKGESVPSGIVGGDGSRPGGDAGNTNGADEPSLDEPSLAVGVLTLVHSSKKEAAPRCAVSPSDGDPADKDGIAGVGARDTIEAV